MKYYVGIDLGGTNIVAGVVDENYNIYSDCIELDERAKNEFLEELSKVETIVNNLKEDEEKWIA